MAKLFKYSLPITYEVKIDAFNRVTQSDVMLIIQHVESFTVVDDVNSLTNTAEVIVSKRGYAIDSNNVIVRNNNLEEDEIRKGSRITIAAGYDGVMKQVFDGYITEYKMDETSVVFTCEDEMYKLKTGKTLKNSFPNPLKKDVVEAGNRFEGQTLKLAHILYWMFINVTVDYEIFCYNLDSIGKLLIKDRYNASTILKILKDRFGMYIYFKNVFKSRNNTIGIDIPEKRLYVGWRNWYRRSGVDIQKLIKNPSLQDVKDEVVDDYVYYHKFVSRMETQYDGVYNRIIEDNMKWTDTGKSETIVVCKSIQDSGVVLKAIYPDDKDALQIAQALQILPIDATDVEMRTAIANVEKTGDDFNDFIVLESDETNIININIPNLTQEACNEIVKSRYDEKEDDGYTGSFTTFGGFPYSSYVNIGDIVEYRINKTGDNQLDVAKSFTFYVDKVVRTFSPSIGYRQEITTGVKFYTDSQVTFITDNI